MTASRQAECGMSTRGATFQPEGNKLVQATQVTQENRTESERSQSQVHAFCGLTHTPVRSAESLRSVLV